MRFQLKLALLAATVVGVASMEAATTLPAQALPPVTDNRPHWSWPAVLTAIFLCGSLLSMAWLILGLVAVARLTRLSGRPAEEHVDRHPGFTGGPRDTIMVNELRRRCAVPNASRSQ